MKMGAWESVYRKPRGINLAVAVLFVGMPLVLTAQQPDYPPDIADARVEVFKSVGAVDLNMWVFEPRDHDASRQEPAVVFFFGGGFIRGRPRQFENQAKYLALRGMVAFIADYRVLERHGTTMDVAVQDAKAAIRWVRENANRLGVDPGRIAAAGGSSGGQLAAGTAMLPAHNDPGGDQSVSHAPNALALFNPAVTMDYLDEPVGTEELQEIRRLELQALGDIEPESLSLQDHVRPGLPPTIIFHGKADSAVPFETIEVFSEAMRAAGNRCELVGYDGEEHGFFNWGRGDGSGYTDTVSRMDEFFTSLGWLSEQSL